MIEPKLSGNDLFRSIMAVDFDRKPVLADISIVIPTLGREILEECLYWIMVGCAWPGELIIVDQSSHPRVEEMIAHLRSKGISAKYVPSSQKGRAAGLNRGLEQVRSRFVAITDDDCFVDNAWLDKMAQVLQKHPERIVTGRVDPAGDLQVEFCAVPSREPRTYTRPQVRVQPLIGGNLGLSMVLFERIGLFDEHPSLRSAEDNDWGYRALRLGIPIIYDPDIVVRHFNWRDVKQRAARYRDYSRSQGGYYGKHLLSGDYIILLQAARDIVRAPIRWLRGLIRKDQDMIDRGQADTLELIPGIISGIRRVRQL